MVFRRFHLMNGRLLMHVLAGLVLLVGSTVVAAEPRKRPNILLHVADDLSWCHLGHEDDPVVTTPNIDRIAREGVRFTHAFVSSTTCTASRAAMLTGRNFWELEDGANLKGAMPATFAVYTSLLEQAGYHVGRTKKGYGPGTAAGWKQWDGDPAGPASKSFSEFLQKRPSGKPFVFWYGSIEPHRPYRRSSGAAAGIDLERVNVLPYWPDSPQVRGDVADYLAEVQIFDAQLGEMLDALEQTGELDNTVVFVLSDNGMPFPRCKASLYDYGTRVPLLVRWPGMVKPERTVDDLVSYIDLAPTILEIAGLEPHSEMTGRSFLPLLVSPESGCLDASRTEVYFGTEGFARERLWPTRGIRTRRYLLIRNFIPEKWPVLGTLQGGSTKVYMDAHRSDPKVGRLARLAYGKRPPEELYDLSNDPSAITNVADDPAYAQVRRELAGRLLKRLEKTADPRLEGKQPGSEKPAR